MGPAIPIMALLAAASWMMNSYSQAKREGEQTDKMLGFQKDMLSKQLAARSEGMATVMEYLKRREMSQEAQAIANQGHQSTNMLNALMMSGLMNRAYGSGFSDQMLNGWMSGQAGNSSNM